MAKAKATKRAKEQPAQAPERKTLGAADVLMSSSVQAGIATAAWGGKFAGEPDLGDLIERLIKRVDGVWDGDLKSAEAMLYGQAHTLQTIFVALARRASNAEQIPQFQAAMSMALKAQAQCRATLETLAEIKNPRQVAFVKQANIAHGHQQVNNGTPVSQDGQQQAALSHAPGQALPMPDGELVGHPVPATCQAASSQRHASPEDAGR